MSLFQIINKAILYNLSKAGVVEHCSHYILKDRINETSCIIDLGANTGNFYSLIINSYKSTCYAIEASPKLYENLPNYDKLLKYNYALSKKDGPVKFYLSRNTEANSLNPTIAQKWGQSGSIIVEGIQFEAFIKKHLFHTKIEVLKIDIEGAELDLLESITSKTLSKISQLAVEFHDFIITSPDYSFRLEDVIRKLKGEKFLIVKISQSDWREVLFINKTLVKLSYRNRFRLQCVHPMLLAVKKIHIKTHEFWND